MGRVRLSTLALALCVAFCGTVTHAAAEPVPGSAGWIYDPGKVVAIDLTLSSAAESELPHAEAACAPRARTSTPRMRQRLGWLGEDSPSA